MDDENELLLDSIFLELGSEQRRLIIFSLNEKTQRLSKLSTALNITIQEAHRHVSRLESIGLIQHDAGNVLKLTPYGKTIVNLIPSFQFLSENKLYFQEHHFGNVPLKFIHRVGDLYQHKKIIGVGPVLEKWKEIIHGSNEYMKIIIQPYPFEIAREAMSRVKDHNVKFSYIFGENTMVTKGRSELLQKISWNKFIEKEIVERKMLKHVDTSIVVTENDALLLFPNVKDEIDLNTAFFSKDEQFREWCLDLFDYQWQMGYRFNESTLLES